MEIKKRFGLAVREHRQLLKVSQEELAMRIGADQAYVSRIEAGRMNVTLETVEQIAAALQADAGDLLKPAEGAGKADSQGSPDQVNVDPA
ncbi:helix-turn-helix domain-containing protein [Pseudochelatococcus sp. B33]